MLGILIPVAFAILMAICIIDTWDIPFVKWFFTIGAGTNLVACMLIACVEMNKVMGY